MLIDLKKPLEEGAMVPLTITLEKAGAITVDVKVTKTSPERGGYADGHARLKAWITPGIDHVTRTPPDRKSRVASNVAVPWFSLIGKQYEEAPNAKSGSTQQMLAAGAAMLGFGSIKKRTPRNGPFTLPPLPYAYNKNEPAIDAQTMQLHHDKHHAAYVNALNQAAAERRQLDEETVAGHLGRAQRGTRKRSHHCPQQWRRPRQSHHVLADHGRLAAARRAAMSPLPSTANLGGFDGHADSAFNDAGTEDFRLRLGLRHCG